MPEASLYERYPNFHAPVIEPEQPEHMIYRPRGENDRFIDPSSTHFEGQRYPIPSLEFRAFHGK